MILLDTHTGFWWVQGHPSLPPATARLIAAEESNGLGVSAISRLEVSRFAPRHDEPLP